MGLKNRKGLTLIEALITIVLLSTLVVGTLGAFYISQLSIVRARHRMVATGLLREYMEKEKGAGYISGAYALTADTTQTVDGIVYTITRNPNPPTLNAEGTGANAAYYNTISLIITWTETQYGPGGNLNCSERAATYIAQR